MDNINVPDGWSVVEYKEGKAPKEYGAEPGPQTGEDDMHSKYVSPDGEYGAAKTEKGALDNCSYGGTDPQEEPKGSHPYDVGQLHLEDKEVVVEDGRQRGYHYYLVTHPDEEYFYSVIPKLRGNKETYKSPHKSTRKEALEAAYKVLNVTLPASISDQMHYTYPESEI